MSHVTIFGGSGFVGRHIIQALAATPWQVRVAVRNPEHAQFLKQIIPAIEIVAANITAPDSVAKAVHGSQAVINCVGILAKNGAQNFDNVHVTGAENIAKAAHAGGIQTLIHISAIGADTNGIATYAQTKGLGERAILSHFPKAVILRPSIVFGPEDAFFNRFAAMLKLAPFLPAIGGGTTKFQPVYVDDVAAAVVAVLNGKAQSGKTYELGGPEVFSFKELLQRVGTYTHRMAIPLYMPIWFAKCLAIGTKPLPVSIRPITYDQVLLLKNDNVVSAAALRENLTLQALGISQPKSIDVIVPEYLKRFAS